jgi:hypothetical protein
MSQYILPLLINWLVLFVACYIVVEYGQKYLYEEITKNAWAKVGVGSLILAVVLVWTRSTYDTMFTDRIGYTAIQGVVWFLVFLFVLRFNPWHAAGFGIATMLVVAGMTTMVVQSLRKEDVPQRARAPFQSAKPPRKSAGPGTALDSKAQPTTKPAASK